MSDWILPVPLDRASRLLNHGPTVLVSARHDGEEDVMAAAWACTLDFTPPKVTVVLDKQTKTRELIEGSGLFVLQIPTKAAVRQTYALGKTSLHDTKEKLHNADVRYEQLGDGRLPFVSGCSAWLSCKVVPEPRNQSLYDLFIGEVEAAWADSRVFSKGRWHFETADHDLRSLHYIAGGHFYAIGEPIDLE